MAHLPHLHPRRDELQTYLSERGVQTLIHYPIPPHRQKAYAEWKHYHEQPNILFIFTNIISLKSLKNRVNLNESTILDKDYKFGAAYSGNEQLYPFLLTLKDGRIADISYQSPDEDALINLEKQISDEY